MLTYNRKKGLYPNDISFLIKFKEVVFMKTAVIYWSGTGNTEAMAKAVADGAGVEAVTVSDFSGSADDY